MMGKNFTNIVGAKILMQVTTNLTEREFFYCKYCSD